MSEKSRMDRVSAHGRIKIPHEYEREHHTKHAKSTCGPLKSNYYTPFVSRHDHRIKGIFFVGSHAVGNTAVALPSPMTHEEHEITRHFLLHSPISPPPAPRIEKSVPNLELSLIHI